MKKELINAVPSPTVRQALDDIASQKLLQGLSVRAETGEDGIPELQIFGAIGGDFFSEDSSATASGVANFLHQNSGQEVRVLVNSPGGLAFEGIAMYNLLAGHNAKVTTRNVGLAGSAASIILMAGDTIEAHDNSTLWIHRSMGLALGNIDVMMEVADFLDKLDGQLANVYAARTGKRKDTIAGLMRGKDKRDGTNFTAQEAKAQGFIDAIIPSKKKADGQAAVAAPGGIVTADEFRSQMGMPRGAPVANTEAANIQSETVRERLAKLAKDEMQAAALIGK